MQDTLHSHLRQPSSHFEFSCLSPFRAHCFVLFLIVIKYTEGFPRGSGNAGDNGSIPGSGRSPREENGNPLCGKWGMPGKSHGQRSLVGYSPRGCKRVRHNLATKTTTKYTEHKNLSLWSSLSVQLNSIKDIHIVLPISRNFSSCKTETLHPLNNSHCLLWARRTIMLLSVSVHLIIVATAYKRNHTVAVLLWMAYFTASSSFIHIVECVRISFLRLDTTSLYLYTTFCLFIYPFRHLYRFYILAIVDKAVNMCVQISLWDHLLDSFAYILRIEIARSYGNSILKYFWNSHTHTVSSVTVPITFLL